MLVKKVLNNNALIALNDKHKEVILVAKGISYKKKPFDTIPDNADCQIFVLENEAFSSRFGEMMEDIPLIHVKIAKRIIEVAEKKLKIKFNDMLLIGLTEHIDFSINRSKNGINMKNALLWDIKKIYKKEFEVALDALEIIKEETNVEMLEDEAGYIAMHFVNANENYEDMGFTLAVTELTSIVVEAIEKSYQSPVDINSIKYAR